MTFDEADKIVQIWGQYLEYCSKLNFVFEAHIPESFLPFPKETLEKAINIVAEHYHNMGNQDAVNILHESMGTLLQYSDDNEALLLAAKFFNDSEWRESMLPKFKRFQGEWIKTQKGF